MHLALAGNRKGVVYLVRLRNVVFGIFVAVFVFSRAHATPPVTPKRPDPVAEIAAQLEPSRTVVYKQIAGRQLRLHVFEPAELRRSDRRPCFLIFHGGGWVGGAPRRMYPFAEHFARLGMVGISAEYRLANPKAGNTVFDCVKDGRSAVRYVRRHAEKFGIDPKKIIVSGGSAGGHIAAGTALFDGVDEAGESTEASCVPDALVLLFPVIDTSPGGYGNARLGQRWRELSPVHQVRQGVPATLLFHGAGDTVTPFAGAKAFHEAMLQAGNHCELDVHPGGVHGYLMFDRELYLDMLRKTEAFLRSLPQLQ